jgi:biopolymer transport protein ExbB/TolQ
MTLMQLNTPNWHEIKTTIVNFFRAPTVVALGAAALATALTYLLVWLLAPSTSYVYALFYERSWIQPTTTFCFWLTMVILALKSFSSIQERDAYEAAKKIISGPEFSSTLIWSDAEMVRSRFADAQHQPHYRSITFSRMLNALDRLRKTQSTGAVEDYFRTRSDIDAGELETSYAGIRYLIWLVPTLGFIGTVMGIGVGIAGFADILQKAQGFQEIQKALPMVTHNLGTAFDTTLLALGLSAVAVFYMSHGLKRQEQLLEEIDHFCFDDVCSLFQEHSTASVEVVQAIAEKAHLIIERNNGNRAQIEAVIRDELPQILSERLRTLGASVSGHLEVIARSTAQLAEPGRMNGAGRKNHHEPSEGVIHEAIMSVLVPRLETLERTISGHLESIARHMAQLAVGQDQAADLLVTEVRAIKVAQQRASEDIAALRETAGQALLVLNQAR